jgi:formamidopyrimidine-DNA glycosylase
MPELPEIEIVKRSLFKKINKAKIIDIIIKNKNLRYKMPHNLKPNLIGEKILNITRRSKYLIFWLKKKLLLIHFGMSGKLLLMKNSNDSLFKTSFYYDVNILKKHNHIYFKLNNGLILIYNDVRRFGFFKLYNNRNLDEIIFISKLGPEPFNKKFNINYFNSFVLKRKKNIKNLLMDQNFVSGLGNIYVNEALFMSKINPLRICGNLTHNETKSLIFNIKKVLRLSILKGGSSIKDFKNIHGKSGNFQQFFCIWTQQ